MNGKTCVLVSGGVESAALMAWALAGEDSVFPVYIRGGHAWEPAELHWLRRLLRAMRSPRLRPLSVLDVPVRDLYRRASWSLSGRGVPSARTADAAVYLPGRNLLLLSKAAVFCAERGIGRIALGSLASNPFPDASPEFLRSMARAASLGLGRRIAVEAPFGSLHKLDVVRRALGVPWKLTFSCMAPRGFKPCGRCNKCAERESVISRRDGRASIFAQPRARCRPGRSKRIGA